MSDSCDLITVVHQAPLSIGFSRQEYWSGLPFPSPGDLPDPEIVEGDQKAQTSCYEMNEIGGLIAQHGDSS